MRLARLLLAVAITFGAFNVPMPVQAQPQYYVETNYYHCSTGVLIGEKIDDCGGGHWTWGQLSGFDCGTIKEVITIECSSHDEQTAYYIWNGCVWSPTSNPQTGNCSCPC